MTQPPPPTNHGSQELHIERKVLKRIFERREQEIVGKMPGYARE